METPLEKAAREMLLVIDYELLPTYGKHTNEFSYREAKKYTDALRAALNKSKQEPTPLPAEEKE